MRQGDATSALANCGHAAAVVQGSHMPAADMHAELGWTVLCQEEALREYGAATYHG